MILIFPDLLCKNRADLRSTSPLTKSIALKLCNQDQPVEESELMAQGLPIFHTLINTCVENLIAQKYFLQSSARCVPAISPHRF